MSADEFDPAIERLFAQAPRMADTDLFAVEVETRLASRSRVRGVVLALAGLAGGAVAVRETLSVNLAHAEALLTGRALGQGSHAALAAAQSDVQSTLDRLGLAGISLGSLGAMQLFWITAAALVALTAAGAVKLSQEA